MSFQKFILNSPVTQNIQQKHYMNNFNRSIKNTSLPDYRHEDWFPNMLGGYTLFENQWMKQEMELQPLLTLNYMKSQQMYYQPLCALGINKPIEYATKNITIFQPSLTEEENDKINNYILYYGNENSILETIKKTEKLSLAYGTSFFIIYDNRLPTTPLRPHLQSEKMDFEAISFWDVSCDGYSFLDKNSQLSQDNISSLFNLGKKTEYYRVNSAKYGTIKVHHSRVLLAKNDVSHIPLLNQILRGGGISVFESIQNYLSTFNIFVNILIPQYLQKLRQDYFALSNDAFENYTDSEREDLQAQMDINFSGLLRNPHKSAFAWTGNMQHTQAQLDMNNVDTAWRMLYQIYSIMLPHVPRSFWQEEQKSHTSEAELINKEERELDGQRKKIELKIRPLIPAINEAVLGKQSTDGIIQFKYIKKEPSFTERNQEIQTQFNIIINAAKNNFMSGDEVRKFLKDNSLLSPDSDEHKNIDNNLIHKNNNIDILKND